MTLEVNECLRKVSDRARCFRKVQANEEKCCWISGIGHLWFRRVERVGNLNGIGQQREEIMGRGERM